MLQTKLAAEKDSREYTDLKWSWSSVIYGNAHGLGSYDVLNLDPYTPTGCTR